jgi:hypothetical protein
MQPVRGARVSQQALLTILVARQAINRLQCISTNYKAGRAIAFGVEVRAQAFTGWNQACQSALEGDVVRTAVPTNKQRFFCPRHILTGVASESYGIFCLISVDCCRF